MKSESVNNRPAIAAYFFALTFLALGGLFIPVFFPVASNQISFFRELIGLLALTMTIYASHKLSPPLGIGGMAWFIALQVLDISIQSNWSGTELVRQAILLAAAVLGSRIIQAYQYSEKKAKETLANLESQRTAALKLADELLILNGIATIGVEANSTDTLIKDAVSVIDSALHPDYFDIFLLDEEHNILRAFRSPRTADKELNITRGKGIVGQTLADGKVRRIGDVRLESAYLAANPGVQSELCVPLRVGRSAIGVINVESKKLNAFTDADEHSMMTFADQLATAIQKVRLFQSEQRHAQEAEILREAGSIVAATLSQEETIERILAQLKRVIPYDSASVQLLGDGYVEIVGGQGWKNDSEVVGMRFPIPSDNPNTIVIKERRPYVLNDAPSAYAAFREGPHSHIHSFLGVPLIVGDQVIGMLAIDSKEPDFFDENHIRLTTAFADQVAVAIQNARLFKEVQQLAHTDSLTGLNNRRRFFELAQHEIKRRERHPTPLAVIMLDVDHFKSVNDTYGHAIGDLALQTVAQRCKKAVRNIDILGRYGGEEFVSILLGTDLYGARIVAERLRRCVETPPIDTEKGPLTITISIGIAELTPDCQDLDLLLRRADQALYAAKQAGRNRVEVWQE